MIALIALLLSFSTSLSNASDCDAPLRGSRTSIHGDSDEHTTLVTYTHSTVDHCETATIIGKLTYAPDETDVIAIPFGGSLTVQERSPSIERAVMLTRGTDGQVTRVYQVNGRTADYNADAQRWLAALLPRILAAAGINVGPRVARWREQGGVENAVRNIEGLASSGSMRSHYEALLNGGRLSDDDMERVLRSVSENMRSSSGDLRYILSRLTPSRPLSARALGALQSALITMPSSGDKAAVLMLYGASANRDLLLVIGRAAESVASSGDKARVLQRLTSRFLDGDDAALRSSWFHGARTIASSGDLRNVLMSAMPYASSVSVAREIVEATDDIASSGDRSAVLIGVARSGSAGDKTVRTALIEAAARIPSDGDKARVLQALAGVRE